MSKPLLRKALQDLPLHAGAANTNANRPPSASGSRR
jgi:hypothetical protein